MIFGITMKVVLGVMQESDDRTRKAIAGLLKGLLHPLSILAMRLPRWLFPVRHLTAVDAELHRLIEERQRNSRLRSLNDVLSILLKAIHHDGSPMTDRELRDELVTILIAGTESATIAIEWALRDIVSHPSAHERICEEVFAVTGGRPVSAEDLGNLKYLDAAIAESLRMHVLVPWVARKLAADFQVHGTAFPRGTVLAPSPYLVHRRRDLYPDPGQFRPERYLSNKPDPFTWFPFGGSDRRCIGMALAMLEMKVVLATLFQRLQISLLQPSTQVRPVRRGILWAPSDGTQVVLKKRRS